jgi:hypothetical protein
MAIAAATKTPRGKGSHTVRAHVAEGRPLRQLPTRPESWFAIDAFVDVT